MQKTTLSALSVLALSLALMTESSQTQAQDQEEGAVEIDGPGAPADKASPTPEPAPSSTPAEIPPDEVPDGEPSPRASGQPGPWRLYAGLRIGVGGTITNTHEDDDEEDRPFWARVTPGFDIGADYVLWRFLAVGVETRFDWTAIKDRTKFMLWSLALKPRAKHQLKAIPLEVYAALPFGLSITDPKPDGLKAKAGAMLAIAAGATYFLNAHWALAAELGWTWHWMRFEGDRSPPVPGLPLTRDYKARFEQMALTFNALYAF
jgi:hypothetical protein